jgi:outer membrane immunogenic protein
LTKLTNRFAALCALVLVAGAAAAQSDNPWNGFYAGLNAGGAWNETCVSETLNGATIDPAIATTFHNQSCPNSGSFAGGAQIGDNFQYKRLVFGIGADLDLWSSKNHDQSFKYAGAAPPAGTYDYSGKLSPSDFGIISARIGYASLQWLPYLKVGTILTGGSHNSTLSYTPTGAKAPTASFNGGRDFSSAGWVAGGGAEYGLNGPWSITAEYLYANLGKGSSSTTACAGSATACAPFSGISLDSSHSSFTAHMIRIGINYWFSYWGQ